MPGFTSIQSPAAPQPSRDPGNPRLQPFELGAAVRAPFARRATAMTNSRRRQEIERHKRGTQQQQPLPGRIGAAPPHGAAAGGALRQMDRRRSGRMDTAYLSVAFTWKLPEAYQRALWYRDQGYRVRAGGPGVFTRKEYRRGRRQPPRRDCPAQPAGDDGEPRLSGRLLVLPRAGDGRAELHIAPGFPGPPILCDNNLSSLPVEYQQHINGLRFEARLK